MQIKGSQPGFVEVPIEEPGSAVLKDLAHFDISKNGALYAPASPLGQGQPPTRVAEGRCPCCLLSCP